MKIKPDLYLKGIFMGIAEIIPGVSGGTIAFITGIYEELIDSIKSFERITFSCGKYKPLSGAKPFITAFIKEVGDEL